MVQPVGNHSAAPDLGLANITVELQNEIKDAATNVTAAAKTDLSQTQDNPNKQSVSQPLEETLDSMNESLRAWSTGLKFEIDDDLGRVVVSIIDSKSGDILRKVPSDTVLKVAKMIVQMQGSSIDTQA